MHIDWLIPCRYVEVHDNLGTVIGAGLDTLWVQELPTPIQVVLAVRLVAPPDELDAQVDHTARNVVRGPDDEVLSDLSATFQIGGSAARPDWLVGIMLSTAVQWEATEEGTYTIEHHVDDAQSSVPVHIVQGPPPGMQPPPE